MADPGDETVALAEAVRELRQEIAALRAEQAAHACSCVHYHSYAYPALPPQPYVPPFTVACEPARLTVGAGTSVAAPVPQIQTFALSN